MTIQKLEVLARTPQGYILQSSKIVYENEEFLTFPTREIIDGFSVVGKSARLSIHGEGTLYHQNNVISLPQNFDFDFKLSENDSEIHLKLYKGCSATFTLFSDDWLNTRIFYKELVDTFSLEPVGEQTFFFTTVNNSGTVTYGPGSDSEFPNGQNVLVPAILRPANYSRSGQRFYINPLYAEITANGGGSVTGIKQWGLSPNACNLPINLATTRNYFSCPKFRGYKGPAQSLSGVHNYEGFYNFPDRSAKKIVPRGPIYFRLRPDLMTGINAASNTPLATQLKITVY